MLEDLFSGENLQLSYDDREGRPVLYLGSEGDTWYVINLEKAIKLRDALNDGIERMTPKFIDVIREGWNKPHTVEDFQIKIEERE